MPLTSLAGNHALKERLLPRLQAGDLGHAFIVAGPVGSGRHTLAAILARAMVCTGAGTGKRPCGSCPACKKALAGIHPDILTVAPLEQGKTITVDQVRQMRADAYIRPNEAPRKVYILEQADRLRGEAQNAMLKLLEEGPAYAAFLLLAENQGSLLTTVRSRCETLVLTKRDPVPSGPEEEQSAQLARTLVDLWLAGDEAGLMERCVPMEKWDRPQFADLTDQMTARLCALLPHAENRRKILKGVELLDRFRQAMVLNVGPGPLYGWLCAAAAD